jgi:hypothetical protein
MERLSYVLGRKKASAKRFRDSGLSIFGWAGNTAKSLCAQLRPGRFFD